MTTVDIVNEGVATTNAVKLFAQHTYQYSTCDPARNAIATLPNLINHGNITVSLRTKPLVSVFVTRHLVGVSRPLETTNRGSEEPQQGICRWRV